MAAVNDTVQEAERGPSVWNRIVADTFMPAGKRWRTPGRPGTRKMSFEIHLA
jgi:hypothetical protein